MFNGAPFLLGKRLRSDDDTDVAAKDGAVSAAAAAASVVPETGGVEWVLGVASAAGFWACLELCGWDRHDISGAGGGVSGADVGKVFQQQAPAPERSGSYFPIGQGHLNLVASLSGAAGSAGRRDDESL